MTTYRNVQADPTSCISPSAGIIGDVQIGPRASVFAGAQLRGDDGGKIAIGEDSNVQELACIHVAPGFDTTIGKGVTIGHGAIVHGCTIEDDALIGMGAIVLNGAVITSGCLVAAGALVTSGKTFPNNSLIMGSPAKAVRTLTDEEVESMVRDNARAYLEVCEEMIEQGMMFHPTEDFNCQI